LPVIHIEPGGLSFDAAEHETLLAAALRSGVYLPSSCRNGTCRTCRCTVNSGQIAHTVEWPGLNREELAEGWVLPCVAIAKTDLVLHVPEARHVAERPD
jgi:ferredoxin